MSPGSHGSCSSFALDQSGALVGSVQQSHGDAPCFGRQYYSVLNTAAREGRDGGAIALVNSLLDTETGFARILGNPEESAGAGRRGNGRFLLFAPDTVADSEQSSTVESSDAAAIADLLAQTYASTNNPSNPDESWSYGKQVSLAYHVVNLDARSNSALS
jgi:hypothetical protein